MVEMTELPIRMLLERLLFPVPRVRWEAARSLANLIRNSDREAARLLLDWIGARQLESEVVLGLGIVDAFDLGACFEFSDVKGSVRAPSHLSDWILKRNFTEARSLSVANYRFSPDDTAPLPNDEEAWFHCFRKSVAHPVISRRLKTLQESTGHPFLTRWEHEWQWLQATHRRPIPSFPEFFSKSDRGRVGWFELGQRELFVSAYLRTFAFATAQWRMPQNAAEWHSIVALSMNRGLAELSPVERPVWTRSIVSSDLGDAKDRAEELWSLARNSVRRDEVPLATRLVDTDSNNFVEFDLTLAIGPIGFSAGSPEAQELDWLLGCANRGEMPGSVYEGTEVDLTKISKPLKMALRVLPSSPGSVESEVALQVRLGSPSMFGMSTNVECDSSEIRLENGSEVLSRWVHWYTDWEPCSFRDMGSAINFITTVSKSRLDRLRASPDVEVARLAMVRQGTRKNRHYPQKVEVETFWF